MIINLVSTSISSTSAPGGEAFHFSLSQRGHYVLAYSSSRIHVLDVTGPDVVVQWELKILRRPASTTITDDGLMLAVLSTDLHVDVYDLSGEYAKHTRIVSLDHAPRTIALSPDGSVLAAAYDSGVEVTSLDPNCISTDRRAVKCYAVDSLSFSRDGTQLLGSTVSSRNPSTVVLTAPYYNPGSTLPEESISALWTTSILFPNGSRDCSHAVLLPSPSDDEASWTFTYDRGFETFRAVRIDDLRNGTTYFTGPTADFGSASKLLPSTLPAASEAGDLVVAGFQGSIWIYGVPEDLDALPFHNGIGSNTESGSSTPSCQVGRRNSAPSLCSSARGRGTTPRPPQWQLLCDKFRNTFVEGRKITSLNGVSAMSWVSDYSSSFHRERLVAVAPGVGSQLLEDEDDGMNPTDGGRISILDFDYSTSDGKRRVITIEVGNREPDVLEEEHRDIATEVALARRRTVAQRRGNSSGLSRSATTAPHHVHVEPPPFPAMPPMPTMPSITDMSDPFGPSPSGPRQPSEASTKTDQSETASFDEEEVFDAPYSQTSPRSGTTLRRAATAVAVNRRLNPRAVAQEHIEYRRADGREEHPHESDADNWVPPPPPYTKEPVPPLPDHIQRSILAENAAATLQRSTTERAPSLDFPGLDGGSLHRFRTLVSVNSNEARRYPLNRARSDSTVTSGAVSSEEENLQPMISPRSGNFDDLYDVSPPGSPQPTPRRVSLPASSQRTAYQIPRRPVGSDSFNNTALAASPPPTMRATIQQPVSPTPQPQPLPESLPHTLNRRLMDWENTTEAEAGKVSDNSRPSTAYATPPTSLTTDRTKQDVPHRPNEDHRLSKVPPTTPIIRDRHQEIELRQMEIPRRADTEPTNRSSIYTMTEEPLPIWRQSGTAPTALTQTYNASPAKQNSPGLVMPSADQMARLNSRQGRPPVQVLSGPSRRHSAGFIQARPLPGSESSSWDSRFSLQNLPTRMMPEPAFRSTPPRGATGAHGSSPFNSNGNGYHLQYAQQIRPNVSPSRRVSLGPQPDNRQTPFPGLRPSFQRLDTIHSVNSTGEPSLGSKQTTLGRQLSRAERSAAKNIKDAKKRGWRASMKRDSGQKKEKWSDGASSAGWTDVSTQSAMRSTSQFGERDGKSGGKCVIM
jgi:hypothetical protein